MGGADADEDDAVPAAFVDELKAERQRMKDDADPDDLDGEDDDEDDEADIWMLKFQKRIERSPTQVVRYCWGGEPLWIAAPPKDFPGSASRSSSAGSCVPRCSCGAERIFELQVLPTLPSQLCSATKTASELKIEWGTVAVYTCSADCASSD